ncbi:MAG: helix-turn-helix domain-containing protein [Planctomycetes bacterium]|nr:helix-turn-helix domain-containing protein [Planctomycetota bacterium]
MTTERKAAGGATGCRRHLRGWSPTPTRGSLTPTATGYLWNLRRLRLHVSRDTVERWINAGDLRAVNVGSRCGKEPRRRSWRVSSQSLDAFLDARANRPEMVRVPKARRSVRPAVIEFIK